MNLGMFMMPLHPPEKDRTQTFEEDAECIILADELGFSEAWIGQHHTAGWEPIPSNDVFIANMLPQTKQIRLGTGVTIITQHHPANVAVRLAYLDYLAKGRLNVGFGQGGVPTDWGLFDLPDPRTQGLMTLEAMEIVTKIWQTDGPFEFNGDYWTIKLSEKIPELGLGEVLKPYQKPHPPIAMSIIKEESMAAKTAGQRGFIPISINLAPPHKIKRQWETYSEGVTESGRQPDRSQWRISRSIFVGDSDAEAREHALNGAFAGSLIYLRGMLTLGGMLDLLKEDPGMLNEAIDAEYIIDKIAIVGSVDTVTQRLQDLYDTTGGFGTLLMIDHDWDDKAKMRRSMELLAKEVVPQLP
ncbi:LLM class flavin-dependent oxidoreductase [Chloroflexi bacterium TSY]|nr:LLM class flavin-dependent oxidoreductase [Chloroflexi bacterium TSY]